MRQACSASYASDTYRGLAQLAVAGVSAHRHRGDRAGAGDLRLPDQPLRLRLYRMDREMQRREMRILAASPGYVFGSMHALTEGGSLLIASAGGSQLGPLAWGRAGDPRFRRPEDRPRRRSRDAAYLRILLPA